jgi:predicted DNA-binding transcriptional regulator YafY
MYTDEEHQVTLAEISEYLKKQGIESSPKTLLRDIEELEEIGVDIVCNKGGTHVFIKTVALWAYFVANLSNLQNINYVNFKSN